MIQAVTNSCWQAALSSQHLTEACHRVPYLHAYILMSEAIKNEASRAFLKMIHKDELVMKRLKMLNKKNSVPCLHAYILMSERQ